MSLRQPNPVCKCGHRKNRHSIATRRGVIRHGHGCCEVRKCECKRFVKRPSKHRVLVASADYDTLVKKRGEVCWICGAPPKKRRLAIDHDHREMYVRGLLCFPCNARLDNRITARWLRDAADYLDNAAQTRATVKS